MAKPIELGLVLEEEDAERFFEYDKNTEVSDELIAMFIEGKKIYEQNQIADGHPTLKGRVCKGRPPISWVVRNRLVLIVQISLIDSIGTFSLVFPGNH